PVGVFDVGDVGGEAFAGLPQVAAVAGRRHGLLKGAGEADRTGGAKLDDDCFGERVVAEGVDLAGGHGLDESAHERLDGAAQRLGDGLVLAQPFAEVPAQQVDVEGGVAVEGGGVELDRADHARAGLVSRVAVVDGGVVVELVLHRMHADGVGDLGGGVDVDVGSVGDHAAEQGDVD